METAHIILRIPPLPPSLSLPLFLPLSYPPFPSLPLSIPHSLFLSLFFFFFLPSPDFFF